MALEESFSIDLTENALLFDSTPHTHSLTFYYESQSAVANLFDAITNNKCKYKKSRGHVDIKEKSYCELPGHKFFCFSC